MCLSHLDFTRIHFGTVWSFQRKFNKLMLFTSVQMPNDLYIMSISCQSVNVYLNLHISGQCYGGYLGFSQYPIMEQRSCRKQILRKTYSFNK